MNVGATIVYLSAILLISLCWCIDAFYKDDSPVEITSYSAHEFLYLPSVLDVFNYDYDYAHEFL